MIYMPIGGGFWLHFSLRKGFWVPRYLPGPTDFVVTVYDPSSREVIFEEGHWNLPDAENSAIRLVREHSGTKVEIHKKLLCMQTELPIKITTQKD